MAVLIDTPVLDHASAYVWLIENTTPLINYVFNDHAEITARNRTSHSKQNHEEGVKRNVVITSRAIKPLCVSDVQISAGLNDVTVSYVRRAKEDFVTASHNSIDSDTGHDYEVSIWNGSSLLGQVTTKENSAVLGVVWNDDYRVEVVTRDGNLESRTVFK